MTTPKTIDIEVDVRKGLPSASSLDADIRCFGRRALCAKVPKKPGSKWAEKGIRIHNVMDGKDPSALPKAEQTTAYIMQGEEDRVMEKYNFIGGEVSEVIREKRFWALNEFGEEIYSGQLDALYVQENRFAVCDYKSGFMKTVPILRNFQIKAQVALAFLAHPEAKSAVATIIHPFNPDSMSETMMFATKELEALPGIIESYIEQMTSEAPRTPNDVSCAFCDAKGLCPEYQAQMTALMPQGLKTPVTARWQLYRPEERAERLDIFKMAETIIKEEREAYEKLLKEDPNAIPGWKLQSTGSTATITDQEIAKDLVRTELGPDAADGLFEISRSSLSGHYQAMGLGEKKAKEKADQVLASVISYKAKKKSLVRE